MLGDEDLSIEDVMKLANVCEESLDYTIRNIYQKEKFFLDNSYLEKLIEERNAEKIVNIISNRYFVKIDGKYYFLKSDLNMGKKY